MDTDSTEDRPKTFSDKEKLWCLGVSSPSAVLSVEVVINENKIKSALIKFLGFAVGRLTSNSRLRSLFQNCLSSNFKPLLWKLLFFCLFLPVLSKTTVTQFADPEVTQKALSATRVLFGFMVIYYCGTERGGLQESCLRDESPVTRDCSDFASQRL